MQNGVISGISTKVSALVQGTVMLFPKNEQENFALLDAVYQMGSLSGGFEPLHKR